MRYRDLLEAGEIEIIEPEKSRSAWPDFGVDDPKTNRSWEQGPDAELMNIWDYGELVSYDEFMAYLKRNSDRLIKRGGSGAPDQIGVSETRVRWSDDKNIDRAYFSAGYGDTEYWIDPEWGKGFDAEPDRLMIEAIMPTKFEIVDPQSIDWDDAPDDYYYHVTSRPQQVRRKGLRPGQRPSMDDGFYRTYAAGKVFFCERPGVPYWLGRVGDHLESQYDRPPKLSVVRFPKSLVTDPQDDPLGTRDSRTGSYFVTHPIT